MKDKVALFAATLLHSATNAHFFHWSTGSIAKHEALGVYYDEIIDAVDVYIECFMGIYGKIEEFPNCYHEPKEPIAYMQSLQVFVREARDDLPKDSELCNLVDGIADLINKTVYKLKFLE